MYGVRTSLVVSLCLEHILDISPYDKKEKAMQKSTIKFTRFAACTLFLNVLFSNATVLAEVLPQADVAIRIPLAAKPTTRPMGVAYVPAYQRYYIADGGLGPVPGDQQASFSKSMVHAYDADGKYLQSVQPGYDNRAIYFNPDSYQLEVITYNISSDAGFSPNTGIFRLDLDDQGNLKSTSGDILGFNPAFGEAGTMPSYQPGSHLYFAKQEHSNRVFIVAADKREKIGEIMLDLKSAGAQHDDISEHFVAYTGLSGEELALLDVDHKAVLVFDIKGKYVGKSALPATMKLRSQNHLNGMGYTNGLFFVYHENEGEFGTYYGFRISSLAR